MSATDGPIVPSISGRLLDLFDPSSETVMDRLAEPLIRMSLLPRRGRCPAVKRPPRRRSMQNYGGPPPDATFAVAARSGVRKYAGRPFTLADSSHDTAYGAPS